MFREELRMNYDNKEQSAALVKSYADLKAKRDTRDLIIAGACLCFVLGFAVGAFVLTY